MVYNSLNDKRIPLTVDMLDGDFKTSFLEKNAVYDKSIFVVRYDHHIYEKLRMKDGKQGYGKNEYRQEFLFDNADKAFSKLNDLYNYSCNKLVELEEKTIEIIKQEKGMARISESNYNSNAIFRVHGHGFGTPKAYTSFGKEFKVYPMGNRFRGKISEIVVE